MFLHTPSSPSLSFKIIKAHSKPDNVLLLSAFKSMVQNQRMDRSISVLRGNSIPSSVTRNAASTEAGASVMSTETAETDVLKALSQIIDPDFGTDIVSCGFVKDLHIDEALGEVSFRLELTTPACPVKDMVNDPIMLFEQELTYV